MKIRIHILIAILGAIFVQLAVAQRPAANSDLAGYEPKHGDIVFQSLPSSPLTDMIEGVTRSSYSHCGIVLQKSGGWMVIEAIGPVRQIPLSDWIHQGLRNGFAAYRLKPPYNANADVFVNRAEHYIGRPYDFRYEMDDEKIYCSELVFKAFRSAAHEDLGHLLKLKELNWKPYAGLIRQIEGGPVPLDREIITPISIANADQLECVYARRISPMLAATVKAARVAKD
jgi:hypothetical protein